MKLCTGLAKDDDHYYCYYFLSFLLFSFSVGFRVNCFIYHFFLCSLLSFISFTLVFFLVLGLLQN